MMNQPYEIIIEKADETKPNMVIEAHKGQIKIVFNECRLFNTLANIDAILVALNDKTKELIKDHLKTMAKEETDKIEAV